MGTKREPFVLVSQEMCNDPLNVAILQFLQRHGRATNQEVGEAVGLSASAASRRIQALEDCGVIRGYQALVSDKALGRSMTVFIRVTLERQSAGLLQTFETAIQRCPGVISCHLMAGQYDYMLLVKVSDISDYERLHQKELSRLPGVTRIESSFAVRAVIQNGATAVRER
jgi:Lrp/AsnC family transcriptional regulator, leucine-responsive regulatory protein